MAENEKEAYRALIAAHDPEIRTLLDQGFDFVTNAFKAGAAPSGMKARTDREHVRRLQQEGYQVEVTAAYDEQGQLRPSLRGCLKSSGRREPTQHQPRHGEVNHSLTALGQPFIVFAQAA
jgi:hypothetical protein